MPVGSFVQLSIWKLKIWKFENLKIWKFENWKLKIWKFENSKLKIWKLKILKFKIENLKIENLKIENWKFENWSINQKLRKTALKEIWYLKRSTWQDTGDVFRWLLGREIYGDYDGLGM